MERKEPTLDLSAAALKNRVRLTWGEVRELAQNSVKTAPTQPEDASVQEENPVEAKPAAETSAKMEHRSAELSDEDLKRLADLIAPRIEQKLRIHLREALDIALANATQRARSDVERSLGPVIQQTVASELRALNTEMLRSDRS